MNRPADAYVRIVVKLGTRLVNDSDAGGFNAPLVEALAGEMVALRETGRQFVIVSSGSIGMGMQLLGLANRPTLLAEKQACAAVGQGRLMNCYSEAFARHGLSVGQVLLTRYGLDDRTRYINARNTLETLLRLGVVPIINENDTVATEELGFSDNDHLSALVACKMDADLLVLLSDVDGVYLDASDPSTMLAEVHEITREIESAARGARDRWSVGGMETKLSAAKMCMQAGTDAVIANGRTPGMLSQLVEGSGRGTWFRTERLPMSHRKRWIAFGKAPSGGRLHVDEGAARALLSEGRSLLPSGVVRVEGSFPAGHVVQVCDGAGRELARGLVDYASDELDRIKGESTETITALLGRRKSYAAIHRDNLVILAEP